MPTEADSLMPSRLGADHGAVGVSPQQRVTRGHGQAQHGHSHSHGGQHSHAHSHGLQNRWVDLHFGALGDDPSSYQFREVVFSINDGVLLTTCVILGAASLNAFIGMSAWLVCGVGVAVSLSSSFSIAARQWLCNMLDNELERDEIKTEAEHLERYPEEEASELLNSWSHFGLARDTLDAMKRDMRGGGPIRRLRLHAKYELKIDPDRWLDPRTGAVIGSTLPDFQPVVTALVTNLLASLVPLLPWILLPDYLGVFSLTLLTMILSGGSLFAVAVLSKEFMGGLTRSCRRQTVVVGASLISAILAVLITVALITELGLVHE